LDGRRIWETKEQSVQGSCSAASVACRIYAGVEESYALLRTDLLGVPIFQVQGKTAAHSEHAGRGSSPPSAAEVGILSSHQNKNGEMVEDDP